ncbi:ParA family protein, partial [Acidovorax sp. NPDC077664]|uniref:ParA family protein n=1 Tax=Acidovorax sp. NPDC077664 TaxID=3390544 RepID=UPI003CFFD0E9
VQALLLRSVDDVLAPYRQQVSDQLKGHFGDKVFNSVIPRNVRLAEAPSYGLPGVVFDPAAKGSQAFVEFAQEMVERVQTMPAPGAATADSVVKMAPTA